MDESEALSIFEDTSLLPSSVQPMGTAAVNLFRAVDSIDDADMAAYEKSVINQFTDEGDKKLCRETISKIKKSVETFTESIRDPIIALINDYKNKGRVEELEGGKRKKKGGGKEEEMLQGLLAFFIFLVIFQLFKLLAIILGTSVEYVGTSIGNGVSNLFPKKPQSSEPRLASGAMADMYSNHSNPVGRKGGKKSRRQRRRRTVKRR